MHDRGAVDVPAADPLQPQVVGVLAEVHELDDRRAGRDRAAREAKKNSLAVDLHACGAGGRARGRRAGREHEQRERGREQPHRNSVGRWNGAAPGRSGFASTSEPLLEQRGVDRTEVGGRADVAEPVEAAAGDAREAAELLAPTFDPIRNPSPAAPWSVPADAFSARPSAELRPDVREHAVRDAARLEVVLEREQRVGQELEVARQRRPPASRACRSGPWSRPTTRSGMPSAIIAASPASRCGNGSVEVG